MEVTSSAVYHMISLKYPGLSRTCGGAGIPVKTARLYRGAAPEAGYLYIIDGANEMPDVSTYTGCAFLSCGERQFAPALAAVGSDYAAVDAMTDKYRLLDDAADVFQQLQTWDCDLKGAMNGSASLSEVLAIGQKILGRAFVIITRNFSVAAHTPDMSEHISDAPGAVGSISPKEVAELLADEGFRNAVNREGLFVYPLYPCDERYLCFNIFEGKHFIASVISPLHRNMASLDPGEEYLYLHFCGYIREMYLRYADDSYVRRQNDRLHDLVSDVLFRPSDVNSKKAAGILREYGWETNHEYAAVKLRFIEGAEWESSALFLCRQLEKEWVHSCALKLDTCIMWVVNLSLSNVQQHEQSFYQSVAYIVREYICKAGISNTTRDFLGLRSSYMQAEIALDNGQKRDPDYWCYRFDSYVLDYMMDRLTADFSSEHLCCAELLKLLDYDKANGTEYAKTLYNYILYKYNITLASEKMFVHRTTFIRRLERIREISGIDLDSEDSILHLLLSYKILAMQEH